MQRHCFVFYFRCLRVFCFDCLMGAVVFRRRGSPAWRGPSKEGAGHCCRLSQNKTKKQQYIVDAGELWCRRVVVRIDANLLGARFARTKETFIASSSSLRRRAGPPMQVLLSTFDRVANMRTQARVVCTKLCTSTLSNSGVYTADICRIAVSMPLIFVEYSGVYR